MLKRKIALFAVLLTSGLMLSACQTTKHVAATADETAAQISGDWAGDFINQQGRHYPVSFHLENNNGELTGKGNVPDSKYDKNPTLTGTVNHNNVKWTTSSDFTFNLHLSKDEQGMYHLSGPVTGPNHGRYVATKVK